MYDILENILNVLRRELTRRPKIVNNGSISSTCSFISDESRLQWQKPLAKQMGRAKLQEQWLPVMKMLGMKRIVRRKPRSWLSRPFGAINQIKSKLLVLGAVQTTINDQGCQHVTGGGVESIRMFLSKQTGWPTFVHSHPSVKTVERFKKTIVT